MTLTGRGLHWDELYTSLSISFLFFFFSFIFKLFWTNEKIPMVKARSITQTTTSHPDLIVWYLNMDYLAILFQYPKPSASRNYEH
jgi:hypothetical protein